MKVLTWGEEAGRSLQEVGLSGLNRPLDKSDLISTVKITLGSTIVLGGWCVQVGSAQDCHTPAISLAFLADAADVSSREQVCALFAAKGLGAQYDKGERGVPRSARRAWLPR